MKQLIYALFFCLFALPLVSGCDKVDDDFFQGKTWYIVGLYEGSKNNVLMQLDKDNKPSTPLSTLWVNNVLKGKEACYYIQFKDNNSCVIKTDRHTWQGTFKYDLSSRQVSISLPGAAVSNELETKILSALKDVQEYSGNNSYMRFVCKSGDFIALDPSPDGRILLEK